MKININRILIVFCIVSTLSAKGQIAKSTDLVQANKAIFSENENYISQFKKIGKEIKSADWVRKLLQKYYGTKYGVREYSFESKVNKGIIVYSMDANFNIYVYEWEKPIFRDGKGKIRIYFFNLISGPYSFIKDDKYGAQLFPYYEKNSSLNPYQFNFKKLQGDKYRIGFDNSLAYFLVFDLNSKTTKITYQKNQNLNPLYNVKVEESEVSQFIYLKEAVYKKIKEKIWVPINYPKRNYNESLTEYMKLKENTEREYQRRSVTRERGSKLEYLETIVNDKFIGNKKKLLNSRGYPVFDRFFNKLSIIPTEDNDFNYAIYSISDDFLKPKYGVIKFNLKKVFQNKVVLLNNVYDSILFDEKKFKCFKNGVLTSFDKEGNIIN